jgi:hypothetical protein
MAEESETGRKEKEVAKLTIDANAWERREPGRRLQDATSSQILGVRNRKCQSHDTQMWRFEAKPGKVTFRGLAQDQVHHTLNPIGAYRVVGLLARLGWSP